MALLATRRAPPRKTLVVSNASTVHGGTALLLQHLRAGDRVAVSANAAMLWRAAETMALARLHALADLGLDLAFQPIELLPAGSGVNSPELLRPSAGGRSGAPGGGARPRRAHAVLRDLAHAYGEDVHGAMLPAAEQPPHGQAAGAPAGSGAAKAKARPRASSSSSSSSSGSQGSSSVGGSHGTQFDDRFCRYLFVCTSRPAQGRGQAAAVRLRRGQAAPQVAQSVCDQLRTHGQLLVRHVSTPQQLDTVMSALALCARRYDQGGMNRPLTVSPDLWLASSGGGGGGGTASQMQLQLYVERVSS
jgi:hypothetical protein